MNSLLVSSVPRFSFWVMQLPNHPGFFVLHFALWQVRSVVTLQLFSTLSCTQPQAQVQGTTWAFITQHPQSVVCVGLWKMGGGHEQVIDCSVVGKKGSCVPPGCVHSSASLWPQLSGGVVPRIPRVLVALSTLLPFRPGLGVTFLFLYTLEFLAGIFVTSHHSLSKIPSDQSPFPIETVTFTRLFHHAV